MRLRPIPGVMTNPPDDYSLPMHTADLVRLCRQGDENLETVFRR